MMSRFATYLHPQTCLTAKSPHLILFRRYSLPHFSQVRQQLETHLRDYPSLPLRKARYSEYLRVHSRKYLKQLLLMGRDKPLERFNLSNPKLSLECEGLEYCIPGYLYSLGGIMEAIDCMKKGHIDRAYCFSLVGHHAYRNWGHGYCLLNPQAAAAKYAQTQGFEKILIVDWDLHHGDGTQSIFSHDPGVYCISIHHGLDLYMAKLSDLNLGTTTVAARLGHCNIPIFPENLETSFLEKVNLSGNFYKGLESIDVFYSALEKLPWKPNLILIFSGYDSHVRDCGAGVTNWSNGEFQELTEYVLDLADRVNCPVISCHGGGYNIPITISAALSHIRVLANYP